MSEEDALQPLLAENSRTPEQRKLSVTSATIHGIYLSVTLSIFFLSSAIVLALEALALRKPEHLFIHRFWINHAVFYFGWIAASRMIAEMILSIFSSVLALLVWFTCVFDTFPAVSETGFGKNSDEVSRVHVWVSHFLSTGTMTLVVTNHLLVYVVGEPLSLDILIMAFENLSYVYTTGVSTSIQNIAWKVVLVVLLLVLYNIVPFILERYLRESKSHRTFDAFLTLLPFVFKKMFFFFTAMSCVTLLLIAFQDSTLPLNRSILKLETPSPYRAPVFSPLPTPMSKSQLPDILLNFWEDARMDGLTPLVTPFISSMIREESVVDGLSVRNFQHAYASIPNTRKGMVEVFCGIDAEISSDWEDNRHAPVPECLPELLRKHRNYRSVYISASATGNLGDPRILYGFDEAYGSEYFLENHDIPLKDGDCVSEADIVDPIRRILTRSRMFAKGPLFIVIKTCVSHAPYHVPPTWPVKSLAFGPNAQFPEFNTYLNTLAFADHFFERLRHVLEKNNILSRRNTLSVYFADHAEAFGLHGHRQHGSCVFDECMRIPLLVVAPGIAVDHQKIPQCVDQGKGLRKLVDIFSTILEVVQVNMTVPSPLHSGKGLLSTCGHDFVRSYSFLNPNTFSVVSGETHVVFDVHLGNFRFNLTADPDEEDGVSDDQRNWESEKTYRDMFENAVRGMRDNRIWWKELCSLETSKTQD